METKLKGTMCFQLTDYTEDEFNESVSLSYDLYDDDELLSIDRYYEMCKAFAFAMGFSPKTVSEFFDG